MADQWEIMVNYFRGMNPHLDYLDDVEMMIKIESRLLAKKRCVPECELTDREKKEIAWLPAIHGYLE